MLLAGHPQNRFSTASVKLRPSDHVGGGGSATAVRHAVESGRGIHHAEQPHHALDAVEIAELALQACEHGKGYGARGRVAILDRQVTADLPDWLDAGAA